PGERAAVAHAGGRGPREGKGREPASPGGGDSHEGEASLVVAADPRGLARLAVGSHDEDLLDLGLGAGPEERERGRDRVDAGGGEGDEAVSSDNDPRRIRLDDPPRALAEPWEPLDRDARR